MMSKLIAIAIAAAIGTCVVVVGSLAWPQGRLLLIAAVAVAFVVGLVAIVIRPEGLVNRRPPKRACAHCGCGLVGDVVEVCPRCGRDPEVVDAA